MSDSRVLITTYPAAFLHIQCGTDRDCLRDTRMCTYIRIVVSRQARPTANIKSR